MKKILITGGTVFVSRYAAQYFVDKGYEVYVVNRNSRPQVPGVKLIEADRPFYLPGDGGMKLQFFHVKDLCILMERIIEEKPEAHIMNVGNVEPVAIKDWVTMCYGCFYKIPEFVNVSEDIEQRNYFSFHNYEYYLDVQQQNKIYPETIPLEAGLKECAEWYVENESEVGKKPYMEYIDCNLK